MSMSCDTSDYSYAQYAQTKPHLQPRLLDEMTELLEEPVEEEQEQVGEILK